MELDVKAVIPGASGWESSGGKTHVTNWNLSILLHQDIWEMLKEEPKAYFKAPLSPDNILYMSQDIDSGYSSFYADDPNNHGFGGREIELDMFDGSTVTLKGPWSSNSGIVNRCIAEDGFEDEPGFDYVKEVSFYSHDWRSVGVAAAMSVKNLRMLVSMFLGPQWHLAWDARNYVELHAPEPDRCKGRRIT